MKTGYPGLFIPGPTNIPEKVRQAMAIQLEDQRAPDFPQFTLPLFADLKKILKTSSGQVFIFPGSGTAGWEAAIANTLSPGDKVLCSVFGQFSHLWADLCRRHDLDVQALEVEWGKGVPVEEYERILKTDTGHRIKAVLACHNETATGVTSDIADVRRALDAAKHPALLFVDAVSSLASIDFRMDEWGVDACVSGSQKGFMLPTGLAIVAVSDKALQARKTATLPRTFLSFDDMIATNKDGFFPYTPATTLLRGLRASLDMLFEEGLDNVFARHNRLAEGVREAVGAWGMRLCAAEPKWHSDTVSAIMVPDGVNGSDVVRHAYDRYSLSLGVGLAKVAGKLFRIGHLGWLNEIMVLQALAGAEMALRDAGAKIKAGSGVGAAEERFRSTWNEAHRQAAE
jgi:alanine-glyoxylate transaminase/serine-glyoxylate transaminase/serine-pyruvate transaminase